RDRVLKEVSKTLKLILRKQDTLARLGGDEFAVLTDSFNSKKDLEKFSQRIIRHINNFLFTN
ncbi:MAG TPA: diguanylate cyclase, partial [Desulfurella acetivorans]|nr:diguanylate cyclase [Desulfurella acetivorans]